MVVQLTGEEKRALKQAETALVRCRLDVGGAGAGVATGSLRRAERELRALTRQFAAKESLFHRWLEEDHVAEDLRKIRQRRRLGG